MKNFLILLGFMLIALATAQPLYSDLDNEGESKLPATSAENATLKEENQKDLKNSTIPQEIAPTKDIQKRPPTNIQSMYPMYATPDAIRDALYYQEKLAYKVDTSVATLEGIAQIVSDLLVFLRST